MALNLSFDPRFEGPIEKLRAAAEAQGIKTHFISGVRTAEDQRQLYANYIAGQKGLPLPYPERGAVPLAARPGSSLHEQGLAADIEADDPSQQAKLRSLASQFGIRTIGASDPTHFELAKVGNVPSSDQSTASASGAWSPSVSNATAMADALAYAKYRGLNPADVVKVMGQEGYGAWGQGNPNAQSNVINPQGERETSYGDFQLSTLPGAVGDAAKKAGIDVTDPSQRLQANRFAIDYIAQHGYGAWKSPYATSLAKGDWTAPATVGEAPALPSGAASGTQTTAASAPTLGEALKKGDVGGALAALTAQKTKDGKEQPSTVEEIAGLFKPKEAPQIESAPMLPAQDTSAAMYGPASQLWAQTLAASARPLSWSAAPPGAGAGQQYPQVPGTTINTVNPYG
jgi:hypothetical protein